MKRNNWSCTVFLISILICTYGYLRVSSASLETIRYFIFYLQNIFLLCVSSASGWLWFCFGLKDYELINEIVFPVWFCSSWQIWHNRADSLRNAPSVMSFRTDLKTHYFGYLFRHVLSGGLLGFDTARHVDILTLINISGSVSQFWVWVQEIRVLEIRGYKTNHLLPFIILRYRENKDVGRFRLLSHQQFSYTSSR